MVPGTQRWVWRRRSLALANGPGRGALKMRVQTNPPLTNGGDPYVAFGGSGAVKVGRSIRFRGGESGAIGADIATVTSAKDRTLSPPRYTSLYISLLPLMAASGGKWTSRARPPPYRPYWCRAKARTRRGGVTLWLTLAHPLLSGCEVACHQTGAPRAGRPNRLPGAPCWIGGWCTWSTCTRSHLRWPA